MKTEQTILLSVTALLCSMLIGYFLTLPDSPSHEVLDRQAAALGRFTGDLSGAQATALPLPDGLFQVSTDVVVAPVSDADGSLLYYHASNGFVSRIDIASRYSTLVSESALPGLRDVTWSPNRTWVVTEFFGQYGAVFQYFNYQTRLHGNLPSSVTDVAFSPDSSSIALVQGVGDQTNIVLAEPDGSDPRTILKTHLPHVAISWPQPHLLALTTKDDVGVGTLYLLTDTGDLTKVVDSETALRTNWSPDGSLALYSTAEQGLMLYNAGTRQYRSQQVAATAGQCTWYPDGRRILCAVNDKGETKLQQVDLSGGLVQTVATGLIVSPEQLFISADEQFVVFLSSGDHTLYALKLQ